MGDGWGARPAQQRLRFSFLNGESGQRIPSIGDLNKVPLVSLKESLRNLEHQFSELPRFISACTQSKTQPAHGLSIDESGAIQMYTIEWDECKDSVFYKLNAALRNKDRGALRVWLKYVKLLLTGLARLPSRSLIVYRGVQFPHAHDFDGYRVGEKIIWWAFTSCSLHRVVCERGEFLNGDGLKVLFVIACIEGKDISAHSHFPEEREVLLSPAATFKVLKLETNDTGLHIVYMQQMETSPELLEPVSLDDVPVTPDPLDDHVEVRLGGDVNLSSKHFDGDRFKKEVIDRHIVRQRCRRLYLHECKLTFEHAQVLSKALQDGRIGLQFLDLTNNKFGDAGVEELTRALLISRNCPLHSLLLGSNEITDRGAQELAKLLETNRTLTHLWLPCNRLSDAGLARLIETITNRNNTLQFLSLAGNKFQSNDTVELLMSMLQKNVTLKELDLADCHLSKTDRTRVKKVAAEKSVIVQLT